jgi:hypothetical protein
VGRDRRRLLVVVRPGRATVDPVAAKYQRRPTNLQLGRSRLIAVCSSAGIAREDLVDGFLEKAAHEHLSSSPALDSDADILELYVRLRCALSAASRAATWHGTPVDRRLRPWRGALPAGCSRRGGSLNSARVVNPCTGCVQPPYGCARSSADIRSRTLSRFSTSTAVNLFVTFSARLA